MRTWPMVFYRCRREFPEKGEAFTEQNWPTGHSTERELIACLATKIQIMEEVLAKLMAERAAMERTVEEL